MLQIEKAIMSEEFKVLLEHGFIDEVAARNLEIRKKFREMTALDEGRGGKTRAKKKLAEEYAIGSDAISKILYSKKRQWTKKKYFFNEGSPQNDKRRN